jgi:AcrR family transcriptional regulator
MKTRERILQTSLELFNREGEPNVTTVDISNELNISPGNLYYHFRGKEELVAELFARYYEQAQVILREPLHKTLKIGEYWYYLVVVFEHIHQYRFLYRNISLVMQRYEGIQRPMRRLLLMKRDAARAICTQLAQAGLLAADEPRITLLSRNIALTITYWMNWESLLGDSPGQDEQIIQDGVLQVAALLAPWLGEMQQPFLDAAIAIHAEARQPGDAARESRT